MPRTLTSNVPTSVYATDCTLAALLSVLQNFIPAETSLGLVEDFYPGVAETPVLPVLQGLPNPCRLSPLCYPGVPLKIPLPCWAFRLYCGLILLLSVPRSSAIKAIASGFVSSASLCCLCTPSTQQV